MATDSFKLKFKNVTTNIRLLENDLIFNSTANLSDFTLLNDISNIPSITGNNK
jgi:hypothetical protein